MWIGILTIRLYIPYHETVKEKRNRIRSLKDRIRKKFNVSVAEIQDHGYSSTRSLLSVVSTSGNDRKLQSQLSNVSNLLETIIPDFIENIHIETIPYHPPDDPNNPEDFGISLSDKFYKTMMK